MCWIGKAITTPYTLPQIAKSRPVSLNLAHSIECYCHREQNIFYYKILESLTCLDSFYQEKLRAKYCK